MIKCQIGFCVVCLLAVKVLAQDQVSPNATGAAGTTEGINDNLVTAAGKPIGERVVVGLVSEHTRPDAIPPKPGSARIVTAEGLELRAFALTSGERRGAVVGYVDDETLMVRDQKGENLGKVFSPRLREKLKSVSEKTAAGAAVIRVSYAGRPLTEAEAEVFAAVGWISAK